MRIAIDIDSTLHHYWDRLSDAARRGDGASPPLSAGARAARRTAIDIAPTLPHYGDRLSDAARRRFGIDLPYEEQLDWGITRLRHDQLHLCIRETHCDEAILAG